MIFFYSSFSGFKKKVFISFQKQRWVDFEFLGVLEFLNDLRISCKNGNFIFTFHIILFTVDFTYLQFRELREAAKKPEGGGE